MSKTDIALKLIEYAAWPLALTVIALAALLIFRKALTAWVGRWGSVKAFGDKFSVDVSKTTQPQPENNAPLATTANVATPPATGAEAGDKPEIIRITTVTQREALRLVFEAAGQFDDEVERAEHIQNVAAIAVSNAMFERLNHFIFGSQLEALTYLNSNAGSPGELMEEFYAQAVAKSPTVYDGLSFQQWM